MAVIDAHVHVWGAELLSAPWLVEPRNAALRREFLLDDVERAITGTPVEGIVLVAADASCNGSLLRRAQGHPLVRAVVGALPLEGDFERQLDALMPSALLRGVRLVVDELEPGWHESAIGIAALRALEGRGLVLELLVGASRLQEAAAVRRALPGLVVVVDHLGGPVLGEPLVPWAADLADVAGTGAFIKLSGLDPRRGAGDSALADATLTALDAVAPERMMFGSDWPVSTLGAQYEAIWARATRFVDAHSPVFGRTAARAYGFAA